MRMTIKAAGITLAVIAGSVLTGSQTPASAQWHASPYPFCAQFNGRIGGGATNCAYTNFYQCQETVSGVGGRCFENPSYVGPEEYYPVRKRKKRRVY